MFFDIFSTNLKLMCIVGFLLIVADVNILFAWDQYNSDVINDVKSDTVIFQANFLKIISCFEIIEQSSI